MRIDIFIWAVRLFKTQSLAAKACSAEKVKLDGHFIKPSKLVEVDALIGIKTNPIWRTFKVLDIPKSRVGAKLVSACIVETTPEADLKLLEETTTINRLNKQMGLKGRPTKKLRRDWDDIGKDEA